MEPTISNISAKQEGCRIWYYSVVIINDQDRNLFETLCKPGAKGVLEHVYCRHSGVPCHMDSQLFQVILPPHVQFPLHFVADFAVVPDNDRKVNKKCKGFNR